MKPTMQLYLKLEWTQVKPKLKSLYDFFENKDIEKLTLEDLVKFLDYQGNFLGVDSWRELERYNLKAFEYNETNRQRAFLVLDMLKNNLRDYQQYKEQIEKIRRGFENNAVSYLNFLVDLNYAILNSTNNFSEIQLKSFQKCNNNFARMHLSHFSLTNSKNFTSFYKKNLKTKSVKLADEELILVNSVFTFNYKWEDLTTTYIDLQKEIQSVSNKLFLRESWYFADFFFFKLIYGNQTYAFLEMSKSDGRNTWDVNFNRLLSRCTFEFNCFPWWSGVDGYVKSIHKQHDYENEEENKFQALPEPFVIYIQQVVSFIQALYSVSVQETTDEKAFLKNLFEENVLYRFITTGEDQVIAKLYLLKWLWCVAIPLYYQVSSIGAVRRLFSIVDNPSDKFIKKDIWEIELNHFEPIAFTLIAITYIKENTSINVIKEYHLIEWAKDIYNLWIFNKIINIINSFISSQTDTKEYGKHKKVLDEFLYKMFEKNKLAGKLSNVKKKQDKEFSEFKKEDKLIFDFSKEISYDKMEKFFNLIWKNNYFLIDLLTDINSEE